MTEEENVRQEPRETRKGPGFLGQAWLVLTLSICFGAGLAAVQAKLGPIIQKNKDNEMLSQYTLVPTAVKGRFLEGNKDVVEALDAGDKLVGYVVKGSGVGFADKVEVLIGLDGRAETITGIFVLSQKETPGLGDKITREPFLANFRGIPADGNLEVDKKGGTIVAVTSATVSSETVTYTVNRAVREFQKWLSTEKKE